MTPKIRIALEVAAAVLAVMAIGAYVSAREDRIKMQATLDAQKTVQAEYQKQISDLAKQMADRDAQYEADKRAQDQRFANAVSSPQIAALLSQVMGLRQPIQVLQPQPTAENPHPSAIAQVPDIDFPQVKQYAQQCEECKLNLAKVSSDAADRQAQAALAQKQIDSLKIERDSAITAAKGGTWMQRIKRNAKWLLIGAVAGAIAVKAHP